MMTNPPDVTRNDLLPDGLSISDLERALGLRSWEWPGRCFEISRGLVRDFGIKGRPVYGFWAGPVAPSMFFDGTAPRVRHGWVVTPDGRIIDPTRFVFEHVDPYIYVGVNDHYVGGQSVAWNVTAPVPGQAPDRGQTAARRRLRVRARTRNLGPARGDASALS